jgi:multiple sugar transport system substrate-binding protein
MTEIVHLKGIAWDHPRCTDPLDASVVAYRRNYPKISISWDRRSLFSFGEGHIDEQAADYDLVIYDHPFIGEVAQSGAMIDLAEYLSAEERSVFETDSLGPSFSSYVMDDRLYALPVDAAAQTAAYRPDLMSLIGSDVPATLDEVFSLADRLRAENMHIVTPLRQIDALCLLFTLSANAGAPVDGRDPEVLPDDVFATCLDLLQQLASASHPLSTEINPIQAYEMMSTSDDIVYAPYMFGYSNYARQGRQKIIRCANIPGVTRSDSSGACIGGAGVGISHRCKNIGAALDYIRFLCAPEYQSGDYVRNGGQPASRSAWDSDRVNQISNNFFHDSFETLEKSYLRPRYPGFMDFARIAGPNLVAFLDGRSTRGQTMDNIRAAFLATRPRINGQFLEES